MTGRELIEAIKNNGWEDTKLFVSIDGRCKEVETAEALFPRLANTNEIVLHDGIFPEQDDSFWRMFYETYMNIADISDVMEDPEGYYILYCDGTEGLFNFEDSYYDSPQEQVQDLFGRGCMFGTEK